MNNGNISVFNFEVDIPEWSTNSWWRLLTLRRGGFNIITWNNLFDNFVVRSNPLSRKQLWEMKSWNLVSTGRYIYYTCRRCWKLLHRYLSIKFGKEIISFVFWIPTISTHLFNLISFITKKCFRRYTCNKKAFSPLSVSVNEISS